MFIESVRARATCNTIISSHPVSSHRPCTTSPTLSSARVFSRLAPFSTDFFPARLYPFPPFFVFPFPLPATVFLFLPVLIRYAFSYQPCLFVPSLDLVFSALLFRLILSVPSILSLFLYHPNPQPPLHVCSFSRHPSLYLTSPHLIPSLHDVHSILSHLPEVSPGPHAAVPFSLLDRPTSQPASFISGSRGGKREESREQSTESITSAIST